MRECHDTLRSGRSRRQGMMKPDEVEAMLGFYGLSWGTRRIADEFGSCALSGQASDGCLPAGPAIGKAPQCGERRVHCRSKGSEGLSVAGQGGANGWGVRHTPRNLALSGVGLADTMPAGFTTVPERAHWSPGSAN